MKSLCQAGLRLLQFENLSQVNGLSHALSTRTGGVSGARGDQLNLGYHVAGDSTRVDENWRRFQAVALPAGFARVCARQVHGDQVWYVTAQDAARVDPRDPGHLPRADALVTTQPQVALTAFSADCPLVLLTDSRGRGVAVVHAGWRSTAKQVARRALSVLLEKTGASAAEVMVGIGPGIGPCCFEVGDEVRQQLLAAGAALEKQFRPAGQRWYCDLPQAIHRQLEQAGVPAANVEQAGLCTYCHAEMFFSYRRDGAAAGRTVAMIGLDAHRVARTA